MEAQIVHLFSQVPASVWVLLGGALGLSAVQETIKSFLESEDAKLQPSTNVLILAALSSLASGVDFLTSTAQANPSVLGPHTLILVGATHLVYNYVFKPVLNIVKDGLTHRASQTPTVVVPPTDAPV